MIGGATIKPQPPPSGLILAPEELFVFARFTFPDREFLHILVRTLGSPVEEDSPPKDVFQRAKT